jgi:hypothetical protein
MLCSGEEPVGLRPTGSPFPFPLPFPKLEGEMGSMSMRPTERHEPLRCTANLVYFGICLPLWSRIFRAPVLPSGQSMEGSA